jgi:hypothetical protein
MSEREVRMIDINANDGEGIQVTIGKSPDGFYRLWVNVNGICRLRAYNIKTLELDGSALKELGKEPL